MKKKKYTTPGIVKVELKHEQAVLGQCSTGTTQASSGAAKSCDSAAACRAHNRTTGDTAATS